MINNLLEVWYWTIMLGVLVCVGIYHGYCFLRNLWAEFKKRISDNNDL